MKMSLLFLELLDRALAAFSCRDVCQAEGVCDLSGHIEVLHIQTFKDWLSAGARNERRSGHRCHFAQVVRELERVDDRTTDIAERVARTFRSPRAVQP